MKRSWVYFSLIVCAAAIFAFRIFPVAGGFSPVLALVMLSGFFAKDKPFALLIPVAAILGADLYLETYSGWFFTFVGFISLILVTQTMKAQMRSFLAAGLVGPSLFFLISNFGVWLQGILYPLTYEGLITSYRMAIPFYRMSLSGTLIYMVLFYGVFHLVRSYSSEAQLEQL